jgi:hypothetical protein
MESGIYQNGSGTYQNGKWHIIIIIEWEVTCPKIESGIYQSEKWLIPEWHTPNLYVKYIYVFPV